jgi:hypothetical protein
MLVPLLIFALDAPAIAISSAYVEAENGFVSFAPDPEADLDWRSFAEHKFASRSLDRPPQKMVENLWQRRDMFDNAERPFDYPAPLPVSNRFHYLISAEGVVPLRIAKLRGAIRYSFDHQQPALRSVGYYGAILAAPVTSSIQTGGFIFSSQRRLNVQSTPIAIDRIDVGKAEHGVRVTYRDGTRILTGETEPLTESPEPKSAVLFRVNPGVATYLLIQWMPDPSNCEFAFNLYLVEASGLKPAKWTAYNCDV